MKNMKKTVVIISLILAVSLLLTSCSFIEAALINALESLAEGLTTEEQSITQSHTEAQTYYTETEEEETKEPPETEPYIEPYHDDFIPSYPGKTVYINKNAGKLIAYWKNTLTSDRDIAVYECFEKMAKASENEASISIKISFDDAGAIYELFKLDHPEYLKYGSSYTARGYVNAIDTFIPSAVFDGDELKTAKSKFDSAASEIIDSIPDGSSDIEAERIIFDWFCDNVVYDLDAPHAHSIYGAIVEKRAVCQGIAEAFEYLCGKVGIQTIAIRGEANNSKVTEKHRWSAVNIGGSWYTVDPTWGSEKDVGRYLFFNNSAFIAQSHYIRTDMIPYLPDLTEDGASYFNYYGLCFDGDGDFGEAFLRAIEMARESVTGGTKNVMIKVNDKTKTQKYADMIDNDDEIITGLLDRYNQGREYRYLSYSVTKTYDDGTIVFSIFRL